MLAGRMKTSGADLEDGDLPLIRASQATAASTQASLEELTLLMEGDHAGTVHEIANKLRAGWYVLLLHEIDTRVQILYRVCLEANGVELSSDGAFTSHEDVVSYLGATTGHAFADFMEVLDVDGIFRWLGMPCDTQKLRWDVANGAFFLSWLNFRFTTHCNIACRHCFNESGPDRKGEILDAAVILSRIREISSVRISALRFAGGEPFLYPDLMREGIRIGRAQQVREISIYTNGFWATDKDRGRRTLARLREAGFGTSDRDYVRMSCGVYHQEQGIGISTIANAVHLLGELGIRTVLDHESHENPVVAESAYRRGLGTHGVRSEHFHLFVRGHITPIGRGKQLAERTATQSVKASDFGPCHSLDGIIVNPSGAAQPCCGFNDRLRGIMIGNAHERSMQELAKGAQNSPILQFIGTRPMASLREYLERPPVKHEYDAICSLCNAMLDLDDAGVLRLNKRLSHLTRFYPH
jgi:hypothetical protein